MLTAHTTTPHFISLNMRTRELSVKQIKNVTSVRLYFVVS